MSDIAVATLIATIAIFFVTMAAVWQAKSKHLMALGSLLIGVAVGITLIVPVQGIINSSHRTPSTVAALMNGTWQGVLDFSPGQADIRMAISSSQGDNLTAVVSIYQLTADINVPSSVTMTGNCSATSVDLTYGSLQLNGTPPAGAGSSFNGTITFLFASATFTVHKT